MKQQKIERRESTDLSEFLGGENANPRRGAKYDLMARALIRKFPPESILSEEQFDDFLGEWVNGYTPKQRPICAENLRRAGCHPRMARGGDPSFTVLSDHAGRWFVLPPVGVIRKGRVLELFQQFTKAQQMRLRYLVEGVDLTEYSPIDVRLLKLELEIHSRTFREAARLCHQSAQSIEKIAHEMAAIAGLLEPLALPEPVDLPPTDATDGTDGRASV